MSTDLQPCPFCGSDNVGLETRRTSSFAYGVCRDCGAEGPCEDHSTSADDYWNRRAQPVAAIPEATGKKFATFEDWLRSDIPKPTALTPDGKLWEYARHAFNAGRAATPEAGQSVPKLTLEQALLLACDHTGKRISLAVAECFEHHDYANAVIASMLADTEKKDS